VFVIFSFFQNHPTQMWKWVSHVHVHALKSNPDRSFADDLRLITIHKHWSYLLTPTKQSLKHFISPLSKYQLALPLCFRQTQCLASKLFTAGSPSSTKDLPVAPQCSHLWVSSVTLFKVSSNSTKIQGYSWEIALIDNLAFF
jgi:hypothetical protein